MHTSLINSYLYKKPPFILYPHFLTLTPPFPSLSLSLLSLSLSSSLSPLSLSLSLSLSAAIPLLSLHPHLG